MNTRTSVLGLAFTFACLFAIQAQAASANPDLYGHVLFDPPQATTDATLEPGIGDSYGHALLDPDSEATRDAALEPGMGDSYGSVLLSANLPRAKHTRAALL